MFKCQIQLLLCVLCCARMNPLSNRKVLMIVSGLASLLLFAVILQLALICCELCKELQLLEWSQGNFEGHGILIVLPRKQTNIVIQTSLLSIHIQLFAQMRSCPWALLCTILVVGLANVCYTLLSCQIQIHCNLLIHCPITMLPLQLRNSMKVQ